ncbi:alpha/beta fold hydrolase [Zunongwangia profunda]|uniref:alpha/beta fold hydrolase n=1 Tax=Zunongwangia profunda TaxID=398743 RepID=UPI0003055E83|nr:alpha/beta hydrolase [Zunongwangia profunda]|tara:strand:+ start:2345 stop:3253 length:909 start_codon:yes stop_codon:yes gene_type:complete
MVRKKISIPFIWLVTVIGSAQSLPSTQYLNVDNEKIAYIEQGEGEIILLLHGWPQTSYTWRKVIPILSKKYRVIALDLPGLGYSDPTTNYDSKFIANKIHHFLTKMEINSFHLVGHDIGAWIATTYSLLYEKNLKTLCLVDAGIPGFIGSDLFSPENADKIWQFYFNQIEDLPEFLIHGKEKAYLKWFFENKSFVKSAINSNDLKIYTDAYKGKEKLKIGFNYYRAFFESSTQNKKLLRKLSIPVLAIGGKQAVGMSLGNSIKKITNNLTNISIDSCGHYIPEEKPDILSYYLMKTIEGVQK